MKIKLYDSNRKNMNSKKRRERGSDIMGRLYQAKYKKEFMAQKPKTKHIYEWLFDKTFEYETKFGKDVFDFNKEQILEFYKSRNMAFSTLKTQISYLSVYIDWAIKKNYTLIKDNPIDKITQEELKEISKIDENVFHIDVIYELAGKKVKNRTAPPLKNAQDRLLVYLISMGVLGERAKELIELKFEHIQGNVIKLSEINPNRKDIIIDDFGVSLIKAAEFETLYERYRDKKDKYQRDYGLVNSDYVFRKSAIGKYSGEKITYQALLARLNRISKYTGYNLTMKKIHRSGMTYVGKLILDKKGKLSKDDPVVIKSIFERYDIQGDRARWKVVKDIEKYVKEIYNGEK